jgi:MerR family transcriptional regulator, thiopeptide resistance regulator
MEKRIVELGVGELAREAKVSVRTLHHYHGIGLLKPAHVGRNGYRSYGRAEMLRLQEILFYRAVGMGLSEIAALLAGKDDALVRLARHRVRLTVEIARATAMLDALDRTIAELKGDRTLANDSLYQPFPPEKQAEYEAWLIQTYGGDVPAQIAEARQRHAAAPGAMAAQLAELQEIEAALVAAFRTDDANGALDKVLALHRDWVAAMWGRACDAAAYAGLADLYASHPDFVARYERLAPEFSAWLRVAMKGHAARSGS